MIKKFWISGITALLLAAGFSLSASAAAMVGEIPDGIYVGSRSLGGLTEEKANQVVEEYVDSLSALEITLEVDGMSVDTTAKELGFNWSNPEAVEETVYQYTSGNLIERFLSVKKLERENVRIPLTVSVDEEKLASFVEERCTGLLEPAKDATITRRNGEFIVTPSVMGRTIDLEAAKEKIDYTLEQGLGLPITVSIPVTQNEPAVTEEALKTIGGELGTYAVSYDDSNKVLDRNIQNGVEKVNGQLLLPGQTLSGYECMQPFTAANGYDLTGEEQANAADGTGQLATALYNAALRAEIEITQRQSHSMVVSYVRPSEDAAIAGTYKDIKVTNNYETPIYIEGEAANGILTFRIYGKDTRPSGRKITFESETLEEIAPGAPVTKLDNSLAPGTRITEQSGHNGTKSRLWKIINIDGGETERTLLHTDTYNATQAIIRVGPELVTEASVEPESEVQASVLSAETDPGDPSQETSQSPSQETTQSPAQGTTQSPAQGTTEKEVKETTKGSATENTTAPSKGSVTGPTAPQKPTAPTAPTAPTEEFQVRTGRLQEVQIQRSGDCP